MSTLGVVTFFQLQVFGPTMTLFSHSLSLLFSIIKSTGSLLKKKKSTFFFSYLLTDQPPQKIILCSSSLHIVYILFFFLLSTFRFIKEPFLVHPFNTIDLFKQYKPEYNDTHFKSIDIKHASITQIRR